MAQLYAGIDQEAKRAIWLRDWRRLSEQIAYALEYAAPAAATIGMRLRRLASMALKGREEARGIFKVRCDRGAEIAAALGFAKSTATAVRCMDEHWDGRGYPDGLRGHEIPIFSRIIGLAQVMEIYAAERGPARALDEAIARRAGSTRRSWTRSGRSAATKRCGSRARLPI